MNAPVWDCSITSTSALSVSGELDLMKAGELRGLIEESLRGSRPVWIDLSGVSFIDVAGWRAIWEPGLAIETRECSMVVLPSPALIRLLRVLQVEPEPRIRVIEPLQGPGDPAVSADPWWRSGMFDQILDAVLVADEKMRYLDANQSALDLLGWSLQELQERTVADVVAARRAWTEDEYDRFVRDGHWQGEVLLRRRDGGSVSADAKASVIEREGQKAFVSMIRQHEPTAPSPLRPKEASEDNVSGEI